MAPVWFILVNALCAIDKKKMYILLLLDGVLFLLILLVDFTV